MDTISTIAERLDRTIDFLASPEGITAEEDVIMPALRDALLRLDDERRPKKKKTRNRGIAK